MTLEQLLHEAPELYAALIEEGVRQERERALAHLDIARWYASLEEATEAIREGVPAVSEEALNHHYAAVEDERDRLDREAELRRLRGR
ncbi:hypothetical protein [uncultured Alcanivorax sp.]|uniref:hypothetical protein n=1 Tax=uncultured Alcanivorax sp. TaxID=191215 RepID=UPI0025898276|nr:hypothetical protein [uncultured Alcanivorax sp.]